MLVSQPQKAPRGVGRYLENPVCTCACPPPEEDCTVLKDVLTRPDLGWADTICSLEKPYLCRFCEKGNGH